MQGLKFGTDGIRGVVGKDITPRVAYDLGCSLAFFLHQTKANPVVLIGHDTRESCHMLVSGICLGLTSNGVNCKYVGELSTPALAFLTKKMNVDAGVMVTASHNPYNYNGFKLFDKHGLKFSLINTLKIESISQSLDLKKCQLVNKIGKIFYDTKLFAKYVQYLSNKIKKVKLKLCFDCANGVTYKVVKLLSISSLYSSRNPNCLASSTMILAASIRSSHLFLVMVCTVEALC